VATHDPTDYDSSIYAGHHSLGPKANQAAAGNHKHAEPPFGLWTRAAAQSINNNAQTDIQFTAEVADSDNMGDLAVSNTTFTIKTAGFYLMNVKGSYASNVTGVRQFFIVQNGGNATTWQLNANVTGTFFILLSDVIQCAVNDAIKFATLQNSGAALNFSGAQLSLLRMHG
jgi:hypothetical protein